MKDLIRTMPAVALRGITILPGIVVHFDVSRPKSIRALELAMTDDQKIFLVAQRDVEEEDPGTIDLFSVGTIAIVKQVIKMHGNMVRVIVEGVQRGELMEMLDTTEYLMAKIAIVEEQAPMELPEEVETAMLRDLKELFEQYAAVNTKIGREFVKQVLIIEDLERLIQQISNNLPVSYLEKQKILEAYTLREQFETLQEMLYHELTVSRIKNEFHQKVKDKVDQNQKEYILREEMRLIQQELGDEGPSSDADTFREELEKLKADKTVKDKIQKEIDRFKSISPNSSESAVIRGYIETLLDMPWKKMSKDNPDIRHAEQILNEDHYGLEKVKERMLEFLAVRSLTKKGDTPIICLVGPPGTGKTSIARSIARAMDKKYVRICLGGVRDEAEIRGHRRTYVGAMPGRIANGLRQAGVSNPLMLLDEIDKVSSDYKGDTSSALLEVLDSEQNNKFRDHYIEIPLDLSEVFFIATANSTQTIPRPLLDRMEVIEVNSYTENEKFHIAKDYLIPKQYRKNGISPESLKITDKALKKIINGYTREAGVRGLERQIGSICRKAAREILAHPEKTIRVTEANLEKFLGKLKYHFDKANERDDVGIVRGLAWTSVGGDTLQIEVNVMPGKGELKLTGKMGDVMKESAMTGLSYVRSISREYQIDKEFFGENDIHIHIPEGAVPKDGPSAGITMATAMLSAITNIPVRADVAMTGEITLRGRVLPIGGLKEKILAAKNAQIKTVIVPKENEPDIQEMTEEIKRGIHIVYANTMRDVLNVVLVKETI